MTTEQYEAMMIELRAIRQVVESRPTLPPKPPAPAMSPTVAPQPSGVVPPQPDMIIDHAGAITVHFGKNKGVALSQLGERSVEWYATEQPARLDSSGKPYPRRAEEALLLNAARTLFHERRGTLVGRTAPQAQPAPKASAVEDDVAF